MENIWILAIPLFVIITFLYWKISNEYFKNEVFGKKVFANWGARYFYWQGVLFVSGGVTILLIFLLKWLNVLTF